MNLPDENHLQRLNYAIENLKSDQSSKELIQKIDAVLAPAPVFWGEDEDGPFIEWGGLKIGERKPLLLIRARHFS